MKSQSKKPIYGVHPVTEAILAGREIERVFIRKGSRGENMGQLLSLLNEREIPFQFVPIEKLNRITGKNHQGVIAQLSEIEYKNLSEIVQRTYEDGRDPFVVLLDRITDVRNFGAIARTAECAGADAIVLPVKGSAGVNAEAIRTSAGALHRLAVCRVPKLEEAIRFLKDSGLKIAAATERSEHSLFGSNLTGPIALLMGSEEDGIDPSLLKLAGQTLKIPMLSDFDSLNVSVAFGIVTYEIVRQRLQENPSLQH